MNLPSKVIIGSDHAGYDLKLACITFLKSKGIEIKDVGPFESDSVDYPDFIHPVGQAIDSGEFEIGVVICGSGQGAAITANKHQSVRCALCWNTELAELSRKHNNANVLSLAARFFSTEENLQILQTFLTTEFEGGRHQRRVLKIPT